MNWFKFILSFILLLNLNCTSTEKFAPRHGETLIVLGFPATADGHPTALMKYRLDKALKIYKNLKVGTIIVTGGAVQNQFAEADVMKEYLVENGVPDSLIITETRANSTFGNAYYSSQILKRYQLKNPIIVTSEEHEERARYTFSIYIKEFRMAGEVLSD